MLGNRQDTSWEARYQKDMQEAKKNLILSLKELEKENKFIQKLSLENIKKFKNLYLTKEDKPDLKYFCFDDLWGKIKNIFDSIISIKSIDKSDHKKEFRAVIKILIDAGVPFVDGKKLTFWSTQFARAQGVKYSEKNNMVTDGIAQEYMRKILLGWPDGKLDVLFPLIKPGSNYPDLRAFFWSTISTIYAEEIQENDEVHLFIQDSLTIGNFFWNNEMPIIRKKNANILVHQYDITTHEWKEPVNLDKSKSELLYVRRREVHPFDKSRVSEKKSDNIKYTVENGTKIWNQKFKDNEEKNALISWSSPKVLSLVKLRNMIKKMKKYINSQSKSISFFSPKSNKELSDITTNKNDKIIKKLKMSVNFIREHITLSEAPNREVKIALTEEYWLEKMDPKHRPNEFLAKEHNKWKRSHYKESFFLWLDHYDDKKNGKQEEKTISSQVDYVSEEIGKKQYKVNFHEGKICDLKSIPIDTTKVKGKCPGFFAYIITEQNAMLISEHIAGKFHHSSFISAQKVKCAGMIMIENGKILEINNISGHYRPQTYAIFRTIKNIPDEVFATNGVVRFHKPGEYPVILSKNQFLKHAHLIHAFIPIFQKIRNKNIQELSQHMSQAISIMSDSTNNQSNLLLSLKNIIETIILKLKKIDKPNYSLQQILKQGEEVIMKIEERSQIHDIKRANSI